MSRSDVDAVLGRYAGDDDEQVEVQLLRFPLQLFARAREHHDELMRELALLAMEPARRETPARLVELVEVLGRQHGAVRYRRDPVREEAQARGETHLDLTYRLPKSAAQASIELGHLMDAADEFCRSEDLLTLETPRDAVVFRRWYLGQIVTQLSGGKPTPWPGALD